jgi:hypothetical protein
MSELSNFHSDMDRHNHVLNTVLETDIPDTAKRKILDALQITAPDNGFRLVIDFQYEFDMPSQYRSTVVQSVDYWLKSQIRDYKIKAQEHVNNTFFNKAITYIAYTELLDVIYCGDWENDWYDHIESAAAGHDVSGELDNG